MDIGPWEGGGEGGGGGAEVLGMKISIDNIY